MVVERSTNVSAAFDMLLEAIEEEIARTNRSMSAAAEQGDYAAVQQALVTAQQMTAFRERVAALDDEWRGSFAPPDEQWEDYEQPGVDGDGQDVDEDELAPTEDKRSQVHKDLWADLTSHPAARAGSTSKARGDLGRLPRGVRTPEDTYVVPILRVLVAMGGSGRASDVLDGIHHYLRGILKQVDLQPTSPGRGEPRWRNTARWARQRLVDDGLVSGDSPYGIWEITEAGRRYLEEQGA